MLELKFGNVVSLLSVIVSVFSAESPDVPDRAVMSLLAQVKEVKFGYALKFIVPPSLGLDVPQFIAVIAEDPFCGRSVIDRVGMVIECMYERCFGLMTQCLVMSRQTM